MDEEAEEEAKYVEERVASDDVSMDSGLQEVGARVAVWHSSWFIPLRYRSVAISPMRDLFGLEPGVESCFLFDNGL